MLGMLMPAFEVEFWQLKGWLRAHAGVPAVPDQRQAHASDAPSASIPRRTIF